MCGIGNDAGSQRRVVLAGCSTVQIAVAHHDNSRAKDVWSTVGGAIKPSFELVVTTAGDAMPYIQLPPRVERVAAMVAPIPRPSG